QVNESLVFYYHNELMKFAPRLTGTENCKLAGEYLYGAYEEMGLDVEFHEWTGGDYKAKNVIATLEGADPSSNAIFIISAHYDTTLTSPGANDDGSGVAASLAIAKVMSQYSFDHTVKFIAFSGEEVGTWGSYRYAQDAYFNGDNIVAVLNADIIGYADSTEGGRIIRFHTVDRSQWIADFSNQICEKYKDLYNMSVEAFPNYIGSDHQAFLYYGYDSVWIAGHDGGPWCHSPEDTADHINWTYQAKATKFLLSVLAEFAIKPLDIQVILKTPLEGYLYFFNRPLMPSPGGDRWMKGRRGMTYIFGRANTSAEVISKEEIERVIFCIDDNFMLVDTKPPYEWKMQGTFKPLFGRYNLKVYAYTKSGKMATDEMDIVIFTNTYQHKKTLRDKLKIR
ncbi:MAG: Zn-dependent exopeptidase M28, partial [Thermoplasmatales archaeon]|nr:Zn-dependent exopeptidase M28 [Thermoplasmatales archaeon]